MKKIDQVFLLGILTVILSSCALKHEDVMPFKNLGYSPERFFPVSENNSEFTFRAWVGNSTSIDRVFTISYYKGSGYYGKLLEIQSHPSGRNKKDKTTFRQINIEPKSGFEEFISKVDSLNLMDLKDQPDNSFEVILHEPISLYVIEIKSHGKVNHFKFNTHFPAKGKVDEDYQRIQDLIFNEFNVKFYPNNE